MRRLLGLGQRSTQVEKRRVSRKEYLLSLVKLRVADRRYRHCTACKDDVKGEDMWRFKAACGGFDWYWAYMCLNCAPTKGDIVRLADWE